MIRGYNELKPIKEEVSLIDKSSFTLKDLQFPPGVLVIA